MSRRSARLSSQPKKLYSDLDLDLDLDFESCGEEEGHDSRSEKKKDQNKQRGRGGRLRDGDDEGSIPEVC